jgi:hypothetical protein
LTWSKLFLITLVLEYTCLLTLRIFDKNINKKILWTALLVNGITHPLITILTASRYNPGIIYSELAVVLIEAYSYKNVGKLSWQLALAVSFIANGASWGIGTLLLILLR